MFSKLKMPMKSIRAVVETSHVFSSSAPSFVFGGFVVLLRAEKLINLSPQDLILINRSKISLLPVVPE
jgi:hypothetical protein